MGRIKLAHYVERVKNDMLAIWPDKVQIGKAAYWFKSRTDCETFNQLNTRTIWQIARFMWRRDEWKFYDEMRSKDNPSDTAIFNLYKRAFMEAYNADPLRCVLAYQHWDTCQTKLEEAARIIANRDEITMEQARDIVRETCHTVADAKEKCTEMDSLYDLVCDIINDYTGLDGEAWIHYFT